MDEILQAYYRDEINISISSFWDAGWYIEIGDKVNGFTRSEFAENVEDMKIKLKAIYQNITKKDICQ